MGVWTALVVALQLLLCLDVEAQVFGECLMITLMITLSLL